MPDTGLRSNDMQWDFWTLSPETAHQVTILMSDRGTPRTWRNMNGYSSHTYSWMNAGGERFWVKYHFKTVQGIENFTHAEADAMVSEDPDFHRRDLWEAIAARRRRRVAARDADHAVRGRSGLPLQPVRPDQGLAAFGLPADHDRPHGARPQPGEPLRRGRAGRVRSLANIVPGIGLSPDKMLMGRIFSYHDTHLHRIGANYEQLPINAPKSPVHSYNKDGAMTYRHAGSQPVYAPNSYGGPQADPSKELPTWWVEAGEMGRYEYEPHADDDDFVQAGTLYRDVMNDIDRDHLVEQHRRPRERRRLR